MSTHEAICVRINSLEPHPDPETVRLATTKIWDYTIVLAKDSWKIGDLAVYIEPDTSLKLSRPEFSFLQNPEKPKEVHRVSAKRLRGVWSEGLLVPAPEGAIEGQNFWDFLELERYEPPLKPQQRGGGKSGPSEFGAEKTDHGPDFAQPNKFDIENAKKHANATFGPAKIWSRKPSFNEETKEFDPGEFILDPEYSPPEIVLTEKIHGSNSRFCYDGEKLHYGSRSQWKKYPIKGEYDEVRKEIETDDQFASRLKKSFWVQAVAQNPWIEDWCKANPKMYLFGECFGNQDLKYGIPGGKVGFRAFNVWDFETKSFWDFDRMMESIGVAPEIQVDNGKTVPILYIGPYSLEVIAAHTDGKSLIKNANHIREGCVILSRKGHKILKSVSNDYYQRG